MWVLPRQYSPRPSIPHEVTGGFGKLEKQKPTLDCVCIDEGSLQRTTFVEEHIHSGPGREEICWEDSMLSELEDRNGCSRGGRKERRPKDNKSCMKVPCLANSKVSLPVRNLEPWESTSQVLQRYLWFQMVEEVCRDFWLRCCWLLSNCPLAIQRCRCPLSATRWLKGRRIDRWNC